VCWWPWPDRPLSILDAEPLPVRFPLLATLVLLALPAAAQKMETASIWVPGRITNAGVPARPPS